jgi:hypothetical protein
MGAARPRLMMLVRFACRSEPEMERPVFLPGHGKCVFRNLPVVAGSNEVIGVVSAHVPSRLALVKVPRLHVAHTDGVVTVHLDVIVSEKMLSDGEAADDAGDLLREPVGADGSQVELVGRGPR